MINHNNRKIFPISFAFIFYSVLDGIFLSGFYTISHTFIINTYLVLASIFISRLSARCWNFFERLNLQPTQIKKPIYPRFYSHFTSLLKYSIILLPLWWVISVITQEKLSDLAIILFCLITEVILIGLETYRLHGINKHLSDNLIKVCFVGFMDFKNQKMLYNIVPSVLAILVIIIPHLIIYPFVIIPILCLLILLSLEFCLFAIEYLLTPKVFYLDLYREKIIFEQFISPYSLLNLFPHSILKQMRKKFTKFDEYCFQDISGMDCLGQKQAFREYVKYLKYCYNINHHILYKTLADKIESTLDSREIMLGSFTYNVCVQISLDENEFYIPLTERSYLDKSRLLKVIDEIKPLICCKIS